MTNFKGGTSASPSGAFREGTDVVDLALNESVAASTGWQLTAPARRTSGTKSCRFTKKAAGLQRKLGAFQRKLPVYKESRELSREIRRFAKEAGSFPEKAAGLRRKPRTCRRNPPICRESREPAGERG